MSEAKESIITQVPRYFSESYEEVKKVTSPTRAEALQATFVTMFIVIFVAVAVALLDLVFGKVMSALI